MTPIPLCFVNGYCLDYGDCGMRRWFILIRPSESFAALARHGRGKARFHLSAGSDATGEGVQSGLSALLQSPANQVGYVGMRPSRVAGGLEGESSRVG
jgi:hypothetical protein